MALIKCRECGHVMSDKAEKCPMCGCPTFPGNAGYPGGMNPSGPYPPPPPYGGKPNKSQTWLYAIIGLLLAIIVAGGGYWWLTQNSRQKTGQAENSSVATNTDNIKPDAAEQPAKSDADDKLAEGLNDSGAANEEAAPVEQKVNSKPVSNGDMMVFSGSIGPYPITMHLADPSNMSEGEFVGEYYYNERPNSVFSLMLTDLETINIHGSMRMVLKEYSPQGKHTGTFNGQYEARGQFYSGNFTNSKGQHSYFELN